MGNFSRAPKVVRKEEAETWLTKRIPIINSAHRAEDRFSDGAFRFEFWTCGAFHPDAVQLLEAARAGTRKYEIGWKDGVEVRNYAGKLKAPGIRKMLDEHYFKHPLADVAQMDPVGEELLRSA